ncbi:MAG: hypothetical protein AB1656_15350 [Candidatus Omnitrophota bacterium]
MKFYEQMDPVEREEMIRKAVAFNVSLEGMEEAAQAILQVAIKQESETNLLTNSPASDHTDR